MDALPLEDLTVTGPRLLRLLMELANTEDLDSTRHGVVTPLFDPPVDEVITRIRRHLANDNGSDLTVARLGSRLAHLLGSSYGRVADALSPSRNPVVRRRGIKARQAQIRCLGLALLCTSMTYAPAEKGVWAAINQALANDKRRLREWPRIRDSVACLLVFALIDTRGLSPADINRVFDALGRLSYKGVRFKKADGCSGFFTGIGDAPPGVGEPPEGTRRVQVDAIIPAIGAANLEKRLRTTLVARLRHAVLPKPPRESIADTVPVEVIVGVPGIHAYFQTGDSNDRHLAPGVRPTKVMVVLQDSSDGGCRLYCEDAGHPLAVGEAVRARSTITTHFGTPIHPARLRCGKGYIQRVCAPFRALPVGRLDTPKCAVIVERA
nr:hypothetical protein [Anaerolineae bacterium]